MSAARHRTAFVWTAIAIFILGVLGACRSDQNTPSATDPAPDVTNDVPTLLVNQGADGRFGALVSGMVEVNDQDCLTVGGNLLIAPEGSFLHGDGKTLHLTGYELVDVGNEVQLGGGQEDLPIEAVDEEHRACLSPDATSATIEAIAPGPGPSAKWIDRGRTFAVVTHGSSSCPPTATEITGANDSVTITFSDASKRVCTADFAPTTQEFDLPSETDATQVVVTLLGLNNGSQTLMLH
ncbi:hypothetical protein ACHAAC_06475 [Aeromicrobium sp. CF4.19]|uniref:hypothetical protein n=1 Tax=Aeromicrobium sp. CF4.19 TaxID=3373082 RepID=UPI003EE78FD2